MKSKLAVATTNALKFKEISAALADFFDCEQITVGGYEIQGTAEEILAHKLENAYASTHKPTLVDDTSFEIAALGGFPGPYMKDFTHALGIPKIGEKFESSKAKAISLVGIIFAPGDTIVGVGSIEGVIMRELTPSEKDSINFDPIFMPDGFDRSFAAMTIEEKNKISHRGRAVQMLIEKLKTRK